MIERVEADFNGQTKQLQEAAVNNYAGAFNSPEASGNYPVGITAVDDGGNITTKTALYAVDVSGWQIPKTNWKPTDRFNIGDYNRIKRNLEILHDLVEQLYISFSIEDMGSTKTSYLDFFYASEINRFESNLETINRNMFTQDYGISQRFFDNGPFIKWDELNRIEGAMLQMRDILDRQKAGLRRLPFRLGNMKGERI